MSEIQFARAADGSGIAYRDLGGDGPAIIYVTGMFDPVEVADDDPLYRRFLHGLVGLGRTILFDRRGVGASDAPDWNESLIEQWAEDYVSVMDAAGVDDATLVTHGFQARSSIMAASAWPDRVRSLVLLHPWPPDEPSQRAYLTMMASVDAAFERDADQGDRMLRMGHPSRADDPSFREWYERAGRLGASASTVKAIRRNWVEHPVDYPGTIEQVVAPALVLHRVDYSTMPIAGSEAMVRLLPDARLVHLAGADYPPFAGDVDELVAEISHFLVGEHRTQPPDRRLLGVLFTDLVGSTEQLVGAGDATWRGVLDRHDHVVKAALGRHGGQLIKTTGDGILATFDNATRALDGAVALRAALAEIGLRVRMGVHVGEVERRGDDVAGVTVHAAARIMGCAGDGEVLTSGVVPVVTAGGTHRFEPRGVVRLKGLDGEWELFALGAA